MPEERANLGEAVEAVAGLLSGTPSGGDPAPTEAPTAAEPQADEGSGDLPLTPTLLAKSLGLQPDELFKQFMIPVDGGDPLTMEEFKEAGKELRGVKAAQDELAEAKITHENGVMMQRQIMQRAMAKIPPELLTEQMVSDVKQEHQDHIAQERRSLFAIRPDLESPAKWDSTRRLLIDHLKPYGFVPIEIDGIIDHRMAKYVIDNAERQKRISEFDANSKETPKTPKLQAPSKEPARIARRADGQKRAAKGPETLQDKAVKVAALLGVEQ